LNKTIITNLNQFQDWWESEYRPIMAFDTETTSLNYMEMELVGFSLATNTAACYINFDCWEWLKALLESLDLVIMHNAVFDLKVLYKYSSLMPKQIFCTLTGAQLLNENLSSHSLKYLAEHWLKVPANQIKKWEEVSADTTSKEFANYSMNDAIWAYKLYGLESKALKRLGNQRHCCR